MKTVCVIPARYASTRFPGKPLAVIKGKPLIQRVWDNARRAAKVSAVIIATDDERIRAAATAFGAEVVMTPTDCATGTERVAAVARKIEADAYVNAQGDEPLMPPSVIDAVVKALEADESAACATAFFETADEKLAADPDTAKVVLDKNGYALYFSRAAIPFVSRHSGARALYKKHIGIYAYRGDILLGIAALPVCPAEEAEKLEQIRLLWNGLKIKCVSVAADTVGVDSPDDIAKVERLLSEE
ncbi:MAG: 3-deoxy-manno-octulosonate cytidylyltransferase [Elusimicrobia bacterium HGW-Elusimicrobia-1]|jgi:3-deoxy-manno-octulosonate cytidylyltransferase (CMP-KDO synthetase)|nr:MAG: 3-deoxy-manno-octulosonate cytidylyltransferase [Elusimicrobia bacterium HGW-Elusimicrobia-1]